MRVTKKPEERKEEIIQAAIKLFASKGYEKTSMNDIAKEISVAQGLCYRYFSSKEILFEEVLEKYATDIVEKMKETIKEDRKLKEIIDEIKIHTEFEEGQYYDVFHNGKNEVFHKLLELKVCSKLVYIVGDILKKAKEKGEIEIEDVEIIASFCVYGQIGIINNRSIPDKEKNEKIKIYLKNTLKIN